MTYSDGHVVSYDYDAAGNRIQVIDNGVDDRLHDQQPEPVHPGRRHDLHLRRRRQHDLEDRERRHDDLHLRHREPPDRRHHADRHLDVPYDAFGNRIASTHNGVATKYVIDPTGLGNVAAEYDGSGQPDRPLRPRLRAARPHRRGGQSAYYTFSAIGNTSELTSATGAC